MYAGCQKKSKTAVKVARLEVALQMARREEGIAKMKLGMTFA